MGSLSRSYSNLQVSQPDLENVKPGQIGKIERETHNSSIWIQTRMQISVAKPILFEDPDPSV